MFNFCWGVFLSTFCDITRVMGQEHGKDRTNRVALLVTAMRGKRPKEPLGKGMEPITVEDRAIHIDRFFFRFRFRFLLFLHSFYILSIKTLQTGAKHKNKKPLIVQSINSPQKKKNSMIETFHGLLQLRRSKRINHFLLHFMHVSRQHKTVQGCTHVNTDKLLQCASDYSLVLLANSSHCNNCGIRCANAPLACLLNFQQLGSCCGTI
jgi:hypothetical protein